jgi:Xaa-Pro aminopeptidase
MISKRYQPFREANREYFPRFSEEEYQNRYRKIREEMEKRNLDCLLIYGHSGVASHGQANGRWVSNYWDVIQSYVVFPLNGEITLFNNVESQIPLAVSMSVLEDVRFGGHSMPEAVVQRLKELHMERGKIGISGGDMRLCSSIPYDHYVTFKKNLPNAELHETTDLIQNLRRVPSQEEIKWYEKGAELTDYAMSCLVDAIRPGAKDYELYGAIHRHYDRGGLPMFALVGSTSMSDPRMPYPWFYPSTRTLQKGDVVLTEISADYWGYAGQLCRIVALGEPTKEYWDLYHVALDVYKGVKAILKPGNGPEDVLNVSAKIPKAGYTIQASVMHGWGMYVRPPFIKIPNYPNSTIESDYKFQENEILMIEPNPCSQDIRRGVFFGDIHRVTSEGGISLQRFPLDFKVID